MLQYRSETRRSRRWAAVVLAAVGTAACTGCVVAGVRAMSESHRERAAAEVVEILQIRASVRRAMLDDVNTQMLALFDVRSTDDVEAAAAARVERIDVAVARLSELAGADDRDVRSEARAVLEVLRRDELQVARDADPVALYDWSWDAFTTGSPDEGETSDDMLALADLVMGDSTGALVLNDALDAAYTAWAPDAPEHMTDYVSRSEPYIRSGAGYLTEDPDAPLTDSYVYGAAADTVHPAFASVEARVADSRLWEYDQWVQRWPDGDPGPAPITLDELAREAASVDTDVRADVDRAVADVLDAHDAAARSALRVEIAAFGAAGAILLVLVGAAALAIRRRWRTIRLAVAQGGIDQLTGVANRYRLGHLEQIVASSPDDVHLVAAVDLDGFKHVNDGFGHRAGDAVLVEISRRLQDIVRHRTAGHDASGAVVRMGGDEFVLTLHSRADIDVDAVRSELDAIRSSTLEIDGEFVALRFSTGLAYARGATSLQDLLDAADLACYEDKARRRPVVAERYDDGLQTVGD